MPTYIMYYQVDPAKARELSELSARTSLPAGLKILVDYEEPIGKGVGIVEADSEETLFRWFLPFRPFFRMANFAPALPVHKLVELQK